MVSILVPLYIYPTAGSWQPLLSAASNHPNVNFAVIINPDSGPGTESLPDSNYIEALRSFDQYPNVSLLGYVGTKYGDRDAAHIEADVALYSGWEHEFANLDDGGPVVSLQGIFLDEIPAEVEYAEVISDITSVIRDTWSQVMDTDATVVYNPGVMVDTSFYSSADCIVAFEDAEVDRPAFMEEILADMDWENRQKTAAIVHTYSGTWEELEQLVEWAADSGLSSLFVTDQAGGLYTEWPGIWESLVGLVDEVGS
ncbi:uncharacterized protein DNG_08993 [Cephalotrichum gorgonifer]|uniref:Spherulation-specific family 4 n=1 Tax=Cephalotrichum gorgonifer TaxID=2041049 RepID=A0AAE8N6H9_9PEZI|nr:uncharacterized protein DNG_08993 [Cephalotrichum gorgonifer]